jgi:hypothetical protein
VARGLVEGSRNTHPGQGTANRRFFFASAYLELLWVCDPVEAQSAAVLPTQLWERWSGRNSGACPFGVVFRPRADPVPAPPFASWSYRPAYMPGGSAIEVAHDVPSWEPALFYLPFVRHPAATGRAPIIHPAGIGAITHVALTLPHDRVASPALEQALDAHLLTTRSGTDYLLELGFTGKRHEVLDLRPELPLLFTRSKSAG